MFVLSSGASTEPPVDLDVRGLSFNPAEIAESIHRQGLLNLPGHHVTYAGLGVTGGSVQPRLPAYGRRLLEDLWMQICKKAGAARCDIAESEPVAAPPRATLSVPIVPVLAAFTDADGCPRYARLDDQTLAFRSGQCRVVSLGR
ncbi:hypothetical protein ACWESM_13500 [Nocardia sp. NPDC003999]